MPNCKSDVLEDLETYDMVNKFLCPLLNGTLAQSRYEKKLQETSNERLKEGLKSLFVAIKAVSAAAESMSKALDTLLVGYVDSGEDYLTMYDDWRFLKAYTQDSDEIMLAPKRAGLILSLRHLYDAMIKFNALKMSVEQNQANAVKKMGAPIGQSHRLQAPKLPSGGGAKSDDEVAQQQVARLN